MSDSGIIINKRVIYSTNAVGTGAGCGLDFSGNEIIPTGNSGVAYGSNVNLGSAGSPFGTIIGTGLISTGNTQSTSTSTGAIKTSGGVGIAKNLYVGGQLKLTGPATQNGSGIGLEYNGIVGSLTSLGIGQNIGDIGFYSADEGGGSGSHKMYIKGSNSCVGIGTNSPSYPLELGINGASDITKLRLASGTLTSTFGLRIGGSIGLPPSDHIIQCSSNLHIDSAAGPTSIYLNYFNTSGCVVIRNPNCISDARTKTDILKIEFPNQFETVFDNMKSIGAYHYKYADTYTNKLSSQYGWLAQEVDAIYPEYVTKQRDSIPNIMKDVEFSYEEQKTGYLFNINFSLDNTKQYKFYAFTSETQFDYLENITVANKNNWFRQAKYNNEFFYKTENKDKKYIKLALVGEYVDDRMAISKEKLTQLNWAATLGLIEKDKEQQVQIKTLTEQIALALNKITILESRIA